MAEDAQNPAKENGQPVQPEGDISTLLVEYQAAQSSAQHHDTLVWTVYQHNVGSELSSHGFHY